MKTLKNILFVFLLLGAFSCKKKDDNDPPPTPPVTPAPAPANTMTATINGDTWAVAGNNTSTASISIGTVNTSPKTYVVTGRTQEFNENSIYIGFTYTTGTIAIEHSTEFYATYVNTDGNGYFALTGTMNITEFDTSRVKSAVCDKFKATFSFTTNAIGEKKFLIEEGVIDFEAK